MNSDIDKLNNEISAWNDRDLTDIKSEIDAQGIRHYLYSQNPKPLKQAITGRLAKRFDLINKISYSFPRSGVFVSKGVSRGHPKSNPRKAKDWFNQVVDKNLPDLADIVAEGQGNLIVNSIKIK